MHIRKAAFNIQILDFMKGFISKSFLLLTLFIGFYSIAFAQHRGDTTNILNFTIEQLMQTEVISASKTEQKLFETSTNITMNNRF